MRGGQQERECKAGWKMEVMVYLQESWLSRMVSCLHLSQLLLMVFYCPTGTQNRKWNGNNWNTRYDVTMGNYQCPDLKSLYIFQGITDSSSGAWKNWHTFGLENTYFLRKKKLISFSLSIHLPFSMVIWQRGNIAVWQFICPSLLISHMKPCSPDSDVIYFHSNCITSEDYT